MPYTLLNSIGDFAQVLRVQLTLLIKGPVVVIESGTVYQTNFTAVFRPESDGKFTVSVSDIGRRSAFSLSPILMQLIGHFSSGSTIEQACEEFAEEWETDPEEVLEVIELLRKRRLIEPVDVDESVPASGLLDLKRKPARPLAAKTKQILTVGAKRGIFPCNVGCSVGCRFCYEGKMRKMYNNVQLDTIPRYTDEALDYYFHELEKYHDGPIKPRTSWMPYDGKSHYSPMADVFSLGLTFEQLERILAHNDKYSEKDGGEPWYTTGYRLEPEWIEHFTEKFPNSFRLRLSVITFDDELKNRIIKNPTSAEQCRKLLRAAKRPLAWVLHMTEEQSMRDIEELDALAIDGLVVHISELRANSFLSDDMQQLAERAHTGLGRVARMVYFNEDKRKNITNDHVVFSGPPEAMSWKMQRRVAALLEPFKLTEQDLVLCSIAAEPLLKRLAGDKAVVEPVSDGLGGTMTFATTVGIEAVCEKLHSFLPNNPQIRRVLMPSAFFHNNGDRDLNGGSYERIVSEFPQVTVAVVDIPVDTILNVTAKTIEVVAWTKEWNVENDYGDDSSLELPLPLAPTDDLCELNVRPIDQATIALRGLRQFVFDETDVIMCDDITYRGLQGCVPGHVSLVEAGEVTRSGGKQQVVVTSEQIRSALDGVRESKGAIGRVFLTSSLERPYDRDVVLAGLEGSDAKLVWLNVPGAHSVTFE